MASHQTTLHQSGMKVRAPSAVEPKPKGGSVNSDTTRKETAATPKTLGPREA